MRLVDRHAYPMASHEPVLAFALDPDTDEDRFAGRVLDLPPLASSMIGQARVLPPRPALAELSDRADGVISLSAAIGDPGIVGRYVCLVRFFERAFASPAGSFSHHLFDVVDASPHRFTRQEVHEWFVQRPGVVHGDRREEIVLAGDVNDSLGRMMEAAYFVLLRKRAWKTKDGQVRDGWTPASGTAGPNHEAFLTRGETYAMQMAMYDPWQDFPMDLTGSAERLFSHGLLAVGAENLRHVLVPAGSGEAPAVDYGQLGMHLSGPITVLPGAMDLLDEPGSLVEESPGGSARDAEDLP